jgi:hypothetical protein
MFKSWKWWFGSNVTESPPEGSFILMEDSGYILMEDDSKIIIE